MGVLVWSPLASGWLSGAVREGRRSRPPSAIRCRTASITAIPANPARTGTRSSSWPKVADKAGLTMIRSRSASSPRTRAVTSAIIGPRTWITCAPARRRGHRALRRRLDAID